MIWILTILDLTKNEIFEKIRRKIPENIRRKVERYSDQVCLRSNEVGITSIPENFRRFSKSLFKVK